MALNVNDPNLKLLIGCDESGPAADRVNSAQDNITSGDYDMEAKGSTNDEGFPVVDDDRGGKAINTDPSPGTGFTNQRRWLQSKASESIATHITNMGATLDPGDLADGEAFVLGGRLHWGTFETGTGLGADIHYLWNFSRTGAEVRALGMALLPDSNTTPATGGKLRWYAGNTFDDLDASYTTTGSPPTEYIDDSGWFYYIFRMTRNGSNVDVKAWIRKEDDGTVYTFTLNSAASLSNAAFTTAQKAESDLVWAVGCPHSGTDRQSHYGYQDELWYYAGTLTDDEIDTLIVDGIEIPWSEEIYAVNDHDVRVAVAKENSTFPVPRQLPVGGLNPRHVVGVQGQRIRIKYQGYRAGRPFSIRRIDAKYDTVGPWNRGRRGNNVTMQDFRIGLIRHPGPLPDGAVIDGYDVDLSGPGLRRRRGYRIRRNVDSSSNTSVNSMYSWRNTDDELFWLYKVADTLYYDTGSGATSLGSTGWRASRHIIAAALDDRLVVLQESKRALWDGSTGVHTFGEDAPTGGSVGSTTGTLTGTYVYAYTFYDPNTGDETAPNVIGSVSLSSQGALLSSLDTSPTESRFSQQRIYRSTAGGAAPNLFLIDTQNNSSTYTDSNGVDGTQQVGAVIDSDGSLVNYITATPPDDFDGCFVHQQRMFYWTGRKLYWSEPNEPLRFDPQAFVTLDAPIIGAASQDYRIIAWTRSGTEIIESDYARDSDGNYDVRQNKVDDQVGIVGPLAHTTYNEEVWWLDRRGIYSMRGDKPIKQSATIDNLFRYMNTGRGEAFTAAFNHIRNQIWFSCAFADIQNSNTRAETVIVVTPDQQPRFFPYRTQAAMLTQFDDDLNGIRLGAMDYLGNFKEYESYEGEGQQGNESGTWEDEGTDDYGSSPAGISSISGDEVTAQGSPGWTTDEHRGKSVVLRDRSTGDLYWYMILSNTSDTLTLSDTPNSNLAQGDGYHIGGMLTDIEFSEQDLGSPNVKVIRDMKTEFDDLTLGRFV